jgi:hypothetical protein
MAFSLFAVTASHRCGQDITAVLRRLPYEYIMM